MFLNQETTDADTKFSVTSILSSMASGQLLTPTSYSMVNFLASGSGTTPTLTPTTLVSLEQTFTELQSAAQAGEASGTGPAGCEPPTQSGFVPPIVDPSSQEQSQDSFDSSDADWELSPAKRARGSHGGSSSVLSMDGSSPSSSSSSAPQRKYTRRSRHEKLSPEEERRRAVRRERNKLAAAKCRQRRVDHTNSLVEETEKLEAEKSDLENEIHSLQQQRDQLEFILQAHVPVCKVDPMAKMNFKIKAEPADFSMDTTACSSHHHHSPSSTSRPKSLPLDKNGELPAVVSCAGPGIALSTPSSGLFTFTSLDSLVDGSTGLTPLTAGPVSCSSQVHRSENESGADAVTSPTLISL